MNENSETELQKLVARRKPGPRTPHGKQIAKYNALRTGVFAKIVLRIQPFNERREDFGRLVANLRQALAPRDQFEEILIEGLAFEFLRLARVYQADAEIAPLLFRNVREKFETEGDDGDIAGLLEGQPPADRKLLAADLLMRYEMAIWRQVDRTLDRMQQWRRLGENSAQTVTPRNGGRR